MLCFHCLLKISEPTLPKLRQSVNSLHFDQAIKSGFSTRQDQNIKEITSLQKKLILTFLIENAIHLRAFRQATANL